MLELGFAYLSALEAAGGRAAAHPQLVEQVRESSSISVLDGESVVGVTRVPADRVMTGLIGLGPRLPA